MGLSWLSQRDLVLVLVLVITVTSTAIELTGDNNVCHRLENYTVSVMESYTEPVVVNTFAWCLQIPPRCPKSRIEMRERWRIKADIKQRNVTECCEGYVAKRNDKKSTETSDTLECEARCDVCEYGNCVAPNTCECAPGHRGDGCVSECPPGTWGEKCSRACECQPLEICNPVDGKCHCPPGWQGLGCKEKCPAGLWGVDCGLSCYCDNRNFENNQQDITFATGELTSACHHETGNCINFHQIIVPPVSKIMNNRSDREGNIETSASSTTAASIRSSSTKSFNANRTRTFTIDYVNSNATGGSVEGTKSDRRNDKVTGESGDSSTRSPSPIDYDQLARAPTSTEKSSSEAPPGSIVPEIGKTETSSVTSRIGTNKNDNYNVQQRFERVDTKAPRVKKPSTSGPIVAVVHVSGNGSPDHDGPMIMTSLGAEKIPTHAVPMPLDIAALIVIGSVISLGLTTLAVLAILHIRSKLFEAIRLSICDAEKRDIRDDTIRRGGLEKGNSGRISSTASDNEILACEYATHIDAKNFHHQETPRCMVPEHQTLTRPRPASSAEATKKPESNYSNDYPNIRLFNNLQELLEAHYDRPPSTFRPAVLDIDGEHVYDEIPLQSSATFSTMKRNS